MSAARAPRDGLRIPLSFYKLATNRGNKSRREPTGASGKFFAAPALLFGNARGNLIALIIAPGAYLCRRLVTGTSSALVYLFTLCRGPSLRHTKSQISHFVFAPLALNRSRCLPRVTHAAAELVESRARAICPRRECFIASRDGHAFIFSRASFCTQISPGYSTLSKFLCTRQRRSATQIIHGNFVHTCICTLARAKLYTRLLPSMEGSLLFRIAGEISKEIIELVE